MERELIENVWKGISYRLNKIISYEERLAAFLGHQIRTDPSYVYGDGLRAALEAFQNHGLATVLAHVKRAKKLP